MSRHGREISIHRAPRGSASGIGGVYAVVALTRNKSTHAQRMVLLLDEFGPNPTAWQRCV